MKGKSKWLLISFILGFVYLLYLIFYFTGAMTSTQNAQQAGAVIASVIVLPHMLMTLVAVICNGFACFCNKRYLALMGVIFYVIAIVLMPVYFMFVILEMILSIIGFIKMKKG